MVPKKRIAAVVAVGDELLAERVDTNGPALEKLLLGIGLEPCERRILPDDEQAVAAAIAELCLRYDLVLCCGGLGPTQDDVTRQAIGRALRRPLRERPEALAPITAYFRKLGREMPALNAVQACLPAGSHHILNQWGTAQGFAVPVAGSRWVAALPGPPRECLPMMAHALAPFLKRQLGLGESMVHGAIVRVAGEAESRLQASLGPLFPTTGDIHLGFLLDEPGEILVKLRVAGPRVTARLRLAWGVRQIRRVLGPDVVDSAGRPLAAVVGTLLRRKRQTVAVAESCTGGLIARRLTAIPGSSAGFLEGAVTYSNSAKTRRLGVPPALIAAKGAVSPEVARVMAAGIRRASGADWGIGVTGIAGPTGGSKAKPVGLVYLGMAGAQGVEVAALHFTGERDFIQRRAATAALDGLRRKLIPQAAAKKSMRVHA